MPARDYVERLSPGDLYREIAVSGLDFEKGETKLEKKEVPKFVKFCKDIYSKFPSLGKGAKWRKEYKEAIDFLDWDLSAEEFTAAINATMYGSFLLAAVIGIIVFVSPLMPMLASFAGDPIIAIIYVFIPLLGIAGFAVNYVQKYPFEAVKLEQVRALTHVPEMMGYMIMSMKLVPNLEKSVEFSSEHGKGKIAADFKKLIWDTQLGVYGSLSEGLDKLAYRWGNISEEFKHALMMIRASVLEDSEGKRYALLDKTMDEILSSIRIKMEGYARGLTGPSNTLFYLGVLLPLILIIVLPVGSSFSGAPLANPIVLLLIYNIGIPLLCLVFATNLIRKRPPTYTPPEIPDNYPGLPRPGTLLIKGQQINLKIVLIAVALIGIAFSFFLSTQGIPPKFLMEEGNPQLLAADTSEAEVLGREGKPADYFEKGGKRFSEIAADSEVNRKAEGKSPEEKEQLILNTLAAEKAAYFAKSDSDVTPYNLMFGLLITFGVLVFVFFQFQNIYKRQVQEKIVKMESEFKDSLYVIASRLGENKPIEDALKHTKEFLPNLEISKEIFAKTIDNIALLGMPLQQAIFDPTYGSMRFMPSDIIRGSMQLLVDSVQLGVNVAARSLISLSIQLDNSEKVNNTLSTLIDEIAGMMMSMSVFIAPVVLGITTVLQKIVTVTLANLAASSMFEAESSAAAMDTTGLGGMAGAAEMASSFSGASAGSLIKPEAIASMATPTQFVFIVALYIIELVVIMTFFTTKIQEDNDLLFRLNLAKAMPIALTVFVIAMILANSLVGGFLTG